MRRIVLPAAILALGIAVALPAAAAPGGVVLTPGQVFVPGDTEYVGGTGIGSPVIVPQGSDLVYVNADPMAPHTVTSVGRFNSGEVPFGQSRTLTQVASLAPGNYPFSCTVHPAMTGVLRVV